MTKYHPLTHLLQTAPQILFDENSRFIIMSDIHRGDGSWADDFSKNQLLFYAALKHYYQQKFTYIELGDGDELWENKKYSDILHMYSNVFLLMSQFYAKGRLHLIYGNHDLKKRDPQLIKANLYYYYDRHKNARLPLLKDIVVHEGLVLVHKSSQNKILLAHGHQPDYLNNQFWRISQFLVRYLWAPLETVGIRNPMSTSNSDKKKTNVERRLINWVNQEQQMLIAGHTHRTAFARPSEPPYFNDGCCVHLRYITGLEIANDAITLVKWSLKTKDNGTVYVDKDVLAGPQKLFY